MAKGKAPVGLKNAPAIKKGTKKVVKGRGKTIGMTSRLRVRDLWAKVFADNEEAEDDARMTDADIEGYMQEEFPEHEKPEQFSRVWTARKRYNKGAFTDGDTPDTLSNEYSKDGLIMPEPRGGFVKASSEETNAKKVKVEARRRAYFASVIAKLEAAVEKENTRQDEWAAKHRIDDEKFAEVFEALSDEDKKVPLRGAAKRAAEEEAAAKAAKKGAKKGPAALQGAPKKNPARA